MCWPHVTTEMPHTARQRGPLRTLTKHIKQADLIISTSYQLLEPIERNTSESMADFLEKVATKIQERINQEISSRVVEPG